MLDQGEENPVVRDLVFNALDRMPSFSDELQTNNVLTRRILELKYKKGFAINKEEAEKTMRQGSKNFASNISQALSQNQVRDPYLTGVNLNDPQLGGFKTNKVGNASSGMAPAQQSAPGNLLEFGEEEQQPVEQIQQAANPLGDLNELAGILGDGVPADSHPDNSMPFSDPVPDNSVHNFDDMLANINQQHLEPEQNPLFSSVFYQQHPETFSPSQTVEFLPSTPQTLLSTNSDGTECMNFNEWRQLLPQQAKEGVLFQDEELSVQCNLQQIKYLQRIMLTFNGCQGQHPQEMQLTVQNQNVGDDKLTIQCSPVRYDPNGAAPQAIVMAMMSQAFDVSPDLAIQFYNPNTGTQSYKIMRLPILPHRFIERVEMPAEAFAKNWANITNNQPDSFQKVDILVNNPAPEHVPIDRVLAQMDNVFQNALNLKTSLNASGIDAVGQVSTKPDSQAHFPSNPAEMQGPENVPLMLQAQFYPDIDTRQMRLSLRAANNKMVAVPILNLLKFYMKV